MMEQNNKRVGGNDPRRSGPGRPRLRGRMALLLACMLAATAGMGALVKGDPPGPHEDFGGRALIVHKDIPYVASMPDNEKLMLDVYSNPHEGLWPVAVMIHGGSWHAGDKSSSNKVYVCKVLAAKGYVVFNINYRLVPEVRIKKEAEDAMAAVIWVKQNAERFGGDPERVGVIGGSAGGLLAALVGWASDDPWFVPTGVTDASADSDVKVCALYYPVIDFERTLADVAGGGSMLAGPLLVGSSYQRKIKHISPKYHVDATVPPTIFLTGDADSLKLYPQSVEYSRLLKSLGVDSKLYTAPGKDHGFTWNYWEPESIQSAEEIAEFFDKYLK